MELPTLHILPGHPVHQQLLLVCLILSVLLCLFCVLYGFLCRCRNPYTQPPLLSFYPGGNFPRWWAQLVAGAYMLMYVTFAMEQICTLPVEAAAPKPETAGNILNAILSVGIQYALSLPLVVILIRQPKPERTPRRFLYGAIAIGIGIFFVFQCTALYKLSGVADWLQTLTQCPENQAVVESFNRSGMVSRILLGVTACILAPIAEECFFRGFLYGSLRRWAGPVAAALASSFFFACVHGAVVQIFPLTLVGLVLCLLYERFRTLWIPILFHAAFNASNLLLLLLYEQIAPQLG